METKSRILIVVAVIGVALGFLWSTADAQCPVNGVTPLEVGPANPVNGFPLYFRDTNGLAVELCLDPNFCFFDPVEPGNPFSAQIGFGPEAFWWSADASIDNPGAGFSALLILAVEAAFLGDVADGQQFPFTRLRIRLDVPNVGTYTVTHPYGREVFVVDAIGAGNEVNITRDIPILSFNTIHNGSVGPLLTAVNPAPPAGFVGNFNIDQTVTGSPCGTNFFRVQPPPGVNIGAGPGNPVTTDLFALQGKIFTGVLNAPLTVDRATYARTSTSGQINVFATSAPSATLTVAGAGIPSTPMQGDGTGKFFAHIPMTAGAVFPPFVSVTAVNPPNTDTTINSNLLDQVNITRVDYNIATKKLTVQAVSSDQLSPPTLTAVGIGTLAGGTLTIVFHIPPATVTVQSSAGGSETRMVTIIHSPPLVDFNGDGLSDLSGLASDGTIWVTTDLSTWVNVPGNLSQMITGDFDGNGTSDLAGLASDGTIWVTTDLSTWVNVPGNLSQMITGDFDGNGTSDLAGLASDGTIWVTTNLQNWAQIPGRLSQMITGYFDGNGTSDLAGLASDGTIWVTINLLTWVNVPGNLSQMITGDFDGNGFSDLAGLASDGTIWVATDLSTWVNVPGRLSQLVVGDLNGDRQSDLAGLASDGTIWFNTDFIAWVNIPGRLSQMITGDFDGNGTSDLAGLASDGTIWVTTNRSTWTQIPGVLLKLAE